MQQTGYHISPTPKKFWFLVLFIFTFTIVSHAQLKYAILGNGKQFRNGDMLYLVYEKDGKNVMDSAKVYKKKFVFTGQTDKPVKASLYRNQNPMKVNFVTENLHVYLESGTIKITSPDTLTNASIGGTPLNETLQLYRLKSAPLTKKLLTLKDPELFTESEKKDTALVNATNKKLAQLFEERIRLELEFVKDHPSSPVSLEMLGKISRLTKYIDAIEMAYEKLDGTLKTSPKGISIKENIIRARQITIGMPANDFVIPDINGNEVRLSSFKGNYVLLDFWASWCGPCREEHPNIVAAYEKYKDKGLQIISVSLDTDKGRWLKAIEKDQLIWTQVSDLKGNKGESSQLYGIITIPANFLIDPKGTIIAKDLKGDLLQKELAKVFADK